MLDRQTVAHRMKVLRAESQLTQEDLAKATGLSTSSIADYETAKTTMGLDAAWKLADVFDCPIDFLAGRKATSIKDGE